MSINAVLGKHHCQNLNRALINWNKHELRVVSVVKGIKSQRKKKWQAKSVYKEESALIRVKFFNK